MSYGLAVELANEWEHKVREYKKTHKVAVTGFLAMMIEDDAEKSGAGLEGMWSSRDVANKACVILAERIGEAFEVKVPRKLI
jgi:hypothetical protein